MLERPNRNDKRLLMLIGSAMLACSAVSYADFQTPIVIRGATVITGTGQTYEPGEILIDKGRIIDVGHDITVPAYAQVIDATGLIAYPGWIDAHSYIGIAEKKRTIEQRRRDEDKNPDPIQGPLAATRFANRRGIRPQFHAAKLYKPTLDQLKTFRTAGFTSALVAPRDGIFSGISDIISLGDRPRRQAIVRENIAMHSAFTTGEDGRYPKTLLGVFAQFRQVLLDSQRQTKVQKYFQRHPNDAQRAPVDEALNALQPVLARSMRLFFEANSQREIRRAIRLADEFKLDVVITGGKEAWKVATLLKKRRIPVIVQLKFDREPDYGKKKKDKSESNKTKSDSTQSEKSTASDENEKANVIYEPLKLRKEQRRLWNEQVENAVRLHEAGVLFAFRTRDFEKPEEFFKALRKVIDHGLPEEAALKALTASSAEILRSADQLGSIAPGKIANITLRDKHFSDIKSKTKMLFIDGQKIDLSNPKDANKNKAETKIATTEDSTNNEPTSESAEQLTKQMDEPDWAVEIEADRVPKTKTHGSVFIRNATILPITSAILTHASILIRDGKIVALGADIPSTPDVTMIDGTGLFIMPGIVDCHSHLGLDAVNEAALSISAEVRIADVINPQSVAIYRAIAGGTTTHHTMHGSANPIGGQNAIWKLKYGRPVEDMLIADAPATIKFALGENVTNANFPSRIGKRYPNTRMGVEGTIRMALTAARQYQSNWDDYRRFTEAGMDKLIPRRDLRLEALAHVLDGSMAVHSHCYRSDEILRLLATAEDYGFRIGTLQHVLEGYRIIPEIARHGCGASTFANDWAYKIEAYRAIPYNAAMMERQGICTSLNSDSPSTIRFMGQEAAKCIRWGSLTGDETLKLITINPAKQLMIENRVGSLEIGKDGDLAIFNGHPLNTFAKCIMTIIDGQVFFEADRTKAVARADYVPKLPTIDYTIPLSPHRAYAITGATIHPISSAVIEHGTLVIVEDKIIAVGPDADVQIPPGAGVIDATGQHIYPGLIDAGSQVGLFEIGSIVGTQDQREIATINANLKAASGIHPHSVHVRITRSVGVTTTLATPTGGLIKGRSTIIHLSGWTYPEMSMVDEFALHGRVPSLPVHLPEDKKAAKKIKEAHTKAMTLLNDFIVKAKHYAKVKALAQSDPKIDFEVDLSFDAMIPYVTGIKPTVLVANTYKQILDAIVFAEKHDLKLILSGARDSWKLAATLSKKHIPVILGSPLTYPRDKFEPWDAVYRCASILDEAGVSFCFESQSATEAFNIGTQVGMAVAHGLPQDRAEYALTLSAATILGLDHRIGSLEPGKQADLIVSTDSPLQTASVVTHMFIDGEPIELTNMHTETYERFLKRPAPKLSSSPTLRGPKNLTASNNNRIKPDTTR